MELKLGLTPINDKVALTKHHCQAVSATPNVEQTNLALAVQRTPTSMSTSPVGFSSFLLRVPKLHRSSLSVRDLGAVPLQNDDEYSYLAPLDVGGQSFFVVFDTGSADLWVVSSACSSSDCARVPKYEPTINLALSNAVFNLTYLTGAVTGEVGYETVGFGSYMIFEQVLGVFNAPSLASFEFEITKWHPFTEAFANDTSGMGLGAMGASGIAGLAFPSEASISVTVGRTLLDNLFAAFQPQDRLFSFKLEADATSSSFTVGQLDPTFESQYSQIAYSPVFATPGTHYDYWKLPLLSITVNSLPIPFALSFSKIRSAPAPIAVLDTGTTLVLGPSHDVDNFWTVAGGALKGEDGRWQVRCDHSIEVGFVLGNDSTRQEILLDPADISWSAPGAALPEDGWCLGGIQANDGVFSGDWLFGDVFLRNAYVVHQAPSDNAPPLIGLLGTANFTDAAQQFQSSRGSDSTPATLVHADTLHHLPAPLNTGVIYAASSVLAFFGGAALAVLFRRHREKRVFERVAARKSRTMMKGMHDEKHGWK